MRPTGEVAVALLQAARDLYSGQHGPTLAEMAAHACVGRDAARLHVPKLKARGHLQIVGTRRVDYRNRPVAEYAPAGVTAAVQGAGWVDLGQCMADWVK